MNKKKVYKRILFSIIGVALYLVASNMFVLLDLSDNETMSMIGTLTASTTTQIKLLSLGLTPIFMASIVIQILTSGVSPFFTKMSKTNRALVRKFEYVIMLVIASMQSYALYTGLATNSINEIPKWYIAVPIVGVILTKQFASALTKKGICDGLLSIVVGNIALSFYSLFTSQVFAEQPTIYMGLIIVSLIVSLAYIGTSLKLKIRYDGSNKVIKTDYIFKSDAISITPIVYTSIAMALVMPFLTSEALYYSANAIFLVGFSFLLIKTVFRDSEQQLINEDYIVNGKLMKDDIRKEVNKTESTLFTLIAVQMLIVMLINAVASAKGLTMYIDASSVLVMVIAIKIIYNQIRLRLKTGKMPTF